MKQVKTKPVAGSIAAGLGASLCCGGSLVFASIGLGAFYASLGLWRYILEVLAAGALSIIGINWLFYRRAAEHFAVHGAAIPATLRLGMFLSASVGLTVMAGSFVLLQWFNHAVVNPQHFLNRPEFAHALIVGVPNMRLTYALASFLSLATLWALPFPRSNPSRPEPLLYVALRLGVIFATVGVVLMLVVSTLHLGAPSRPADSDHAPRKTPQHQPSPYTRP